MSDSNKHKVSIEDRRWAMMGSVWAGANESGEKRKRGLRILPKDEGYFVHVTSRCVGQAFLFGEDEKRVFVNMMRKWASFSGLGVLTHCVMDNHFHMMLWVPGKVVLEHAGVRNKLEEVWPEEKVVAWEAFYQQQDKETKVRMDEAVLDRMGNLPAFMRVLKQSFGTWYNRTHERTGTLWDARYRSVVVEDSPLALMSVAAYIDLNPLRAGMVEDPREYRWSGYGAAMLRDKSSRDGLEGLIRLSRGHQPFVAREVRRKQMLDKGENWNTLGTKMEVERKQRAVPKNWEEVQAAYRIWLVNKGVSRKDDISVGKRQSQRRGMDPVDVIAEYERLGMVPEVAGIQKKVRSFSLGLAVGGPEFLQGLMEMYSSCFGPKRKIAGRRIQRRGLTLKCLREVDR